MIWYIGGKGKKKAHKPKPHKVKPKPSKVKPHKVKPRPHRVKPKVRPSRIKPVVTIPTPPKPRPITRVTPTYKSKGLDLEFPYSLEKIATVHESRFHPMIQYKQLKYMPTIDTAKSHRYFYDRGVKSKISKTPTPTPKPVARDITGRPLKATEYYEESKAFREAMSIGVMVKRPRYYYGWKGEIEGIESLKGLGKEIRAKKVQEHIIGYRRGKSKIDVYYGHYGRQIKGVKKFTIISDIEKELPSIQTIERELGMKTYMKELSKEPTVPHIELENANVNLPQRWSPGERRWVGQFP